MPAELKELVKGAGVLGGGDGSKKGMFGRHIELKKENQQLRAEVAQLKDQVGRFISAGQGMARANGRGRQRQHNMFGR